MKRKKRRAKVYHARRKMVYMARRRGFRRYGRRAIGGAKGMFAPIIGGVADAIINPRSPIDGIGSTAVGFLMHDQVVKTIGLYQVGQSIAAFIPVIGTGASGGVSQV